MSLSHRIELFASNKIVAVIPKDNFPGELVTCHYPKAEAMRVFCYTIPTGTTIHDEVFGTRPEGFRAQRVATTAEIEDPNISRDHFRTLHGIYWGKRFEQEVRKGIVVPREGAEYIGNYVEDPKAVDPVKLYRMLKLAEQLGSTSDHLIYVTPRILEALAKGHNSFGLWHGWNNYLQEVRTQIGDSVVKDIREVVPPPDRLDTALTILRENRFPIDTRTIRREVKKGNLSPTQEVRQVIKDHTSFPVRIWDHLQTIRYHLV